MSTPKPPVLPPPLPRTSPTPSPRPSAAFVSPSQAGAVVRREPLKLIELPDHNPPTSRQRRAHSSDEAHVRPSPRDNRLDDRERPRRHREDDRELLRSGRDATRSSGGGGGFLHSVKGLFGRGDATDRTDDRRRYDEQRRRVGPPDDLTFNRRHRRDGRHRVVSDDQDWRYEVHRGAQQVHPYPPCNWFDEYEPYTFYPPQETNYHRSSAPYRRPRPEPDYHPDDDALAALFRRHPPKLQTPSRTHRRREVGLHVPGEDETVYPGDSIVDDEEVAYYSRRPPAHVPADEMERHLRRRRHAERGRTWLSSDPYALDPRRFRPTPDVPRYGTDSERYLGDAYPAGMSPHRRPPTYEQHHPEYVDDVRHRPTYEGDAYEFDTMREALSVRDPRPDPYARDRWSPDERSRYELPPPPSVANPARSRYRGWPDDDEWYDDGRRGLSWREEYWPQSSHRDGQGLGRREAEAEWELRRRWDAETATGRDRRHFDRRAFQDPYDGPFGDERYNAR